MGRHRRKDLPPDTDEHHPFPGFRFRNDVRKELHNVYNSVFLGHRTSWEAARDIMIVAGSAEIFANAQVEALARRYDRKKPGAIKSFIEKFHKLFGADKAVQRIIATLNAFPWMPRGWEFIRIPRGKKAVLIMPDGTRRSLGSRHAILIGDYVVMKKERNRSDNQGLYPEDLESKEDVDFDE